MLLVFGLLFLMRGAICAAGSSGSDVPRLGISKDGGFVFGGKAVFLSGANLPWVNYGADFGNNQTSEVKCALRSAVANISEAGGNSVRVWLFVEGQTIPEYDANGMVVSTDKSGTLTTDVLAFVRYAAEKNVFVNICLWNGALLRDTRTRALFQDDAKLQSFLDNALTPLAKSLAGEPNVVYEIVNEPEGLVKIAPDSEDPCFDTLNVLSGSGAGWTGSGILMKDLLRFHSLHAAAIHKADPHALVTIGSWSEYAATDAVLEPGRKFFNYYSDECLLKASAGVEGGTLDFVQIHTYPANGKFHPGSPLSVAASAFNVSKPVVIGEFAVAKCSNCPVEKQYTHAIDTLYGGIWDWSLLGGDGQDDASTCAAGMRALKGNGKVTVDIPSAAPGPDSCSCSDIPPSGSSYTCAQQASWGKCSEPWMQHFCCKSCFACSESC